MGTTRKFQTLRKEFTAPFRVLGTWLAALRSSRSGVAPSAARRDPFDAPDVLFVMERWCDCDPACGTTNSEHNLCGSLETTGLARQRRFFYDRYVRRTGHSADVGLLREISRRRPSLVIVTIVPGASFHPSLACLSFIRYVLRIPVVFIWFDFADTGLVRTLALAYALVAKKSVVLDAPHTVARSPLYSALFLPLWTPQDPRIFTPVDGSRRRDIDVCFLGSRISYPDRLECLERLRELPIRLVEGGGQREARLSVEEYVELYRRAKIVVNFSANVIRLEADQNKGRVYEATLCGALLLESQNAETRHWLTPGEDYVEFTTPQDLVRKVQWYLAHEREQRRIATLGALKVHSQYNAWRFWERLLSNAIRHFTPIRRSADRRAPVEPHPTVRRFDEAAPDASSGAGTKALARASLPAE